MRLRYVDGESIERIRGLLAIGRSEYFREHARAVDAITAVLQARWGSARPATLPWSNDGALPREITSFIGRQTQVSELLDLLRTSPVLTLNGAGGVGKTRLALAAARKVKEGEAANHARVWFVDLAGLPPNGEVDQTVAASYRVRPTGGQSVSDALIGYLSSEPTLLVLDNCEHVAGQCQRCSLPC